jgi:hypothetical protein
MVLLTLHMGFVIIVKASLSFLGAGIPPPTPPSPGPSPPAGARETKEVAPDYKVSCHLYP